MTVGTAMSFLFQALSTEQVPQGSGDFPGRPGSLLHAQLINSLQVLLKGDFAVGA